MRIRRNLSVLVAVAIAAVLAADAPAAQKKRSAAKHPRRTSTKSIAPAKPAKRPIPIAERLSETTRGEGLAGEGDRWEQWFYGQRAYPAGKIPKDARGKAYEHAKKYNDSATTTDGSTSSTSTSTTSTTTTASTSTKTAAAPKPGAKAPSWTPLGPSRIPGGQTDTTAPGADIQNTYAAGTVSGRISAIAVDPTNPSVVYVGGAQGGVWKTTNGLAGSPSFTPLTDAQPSLAVGDIAVDPVNPQIVYVGTGESNGSCDSYYGRGLLRSTDGGKSWTNLGASTFSGNVLSRVVVDPSTAGSTATTTVWATASLGFYSSGTEQCDFGPASMNGGVFRSTDSGQTWTKQDPAHFPGAGARTYDLVLDPANSSIVYVTVRAPYGGIWKSTNGSAPAGATFTLLSGGLPTFASASPAPRRVNLGIGAGAAHDTVYASIADLNSGLFGLYKTTNGGAAWAHVDAGRNGTGTIAGNTLTRVTGPQFDGSVVGRRVILAGNIARTVTEVVNKNSVRFSGANISPAFDPGTWSIGAYPLFCEYQCNYDMTVGVDPTAAGASRVFIGGNPSVFSGDASGVAGAHSIWRTDDGGATWRSVSQGADKLGGVHGDDHEIVFDASGTVWNGNDGGLWRSSDHGASWANLNTNLAITQFQGLALHPTNADYVIGGTQDNGTNIRGGPVAAPAWYHTDFGDGGQALIDQSRPSTMFHTYYNQGYNFFGPARTDDGGTGGPGSWPFVGTYYGYGPQYYNGMTPTDDVSFYAPLAQNTAFSPNVVYFGSDKVYRSPNPQSPFAHVPSWTAVSPVLTKGGAGSGQFLTAIAPLQKTVGGKEILYTGSSDGRVAVSANVDSSATASWTAIDASPFPNRFVTEIEVDQTDATGNTAYVTVSGFGTGHVFKVTNALSGATWTNLSGDLPDIPANCIALAPDGVYVGTDIGVFRTTDGGAHWTRLVDGFPTVAVFGLDRNPATGAIVAATHGRGMFKLTP